jgi:hypothetical protein
LSRKPGVAESSNCPADSVAMPIDVNEATTAQFRAPSEIVVSERAGMVRLGQAQG